MYKYLRQLRTCQKRNEQAVKYASLHFSVPIPPIQVISMDLIGDFHPKSSAGNSYALAVMCMLTGYKSVSQLSLSQLLM